MNHEINWKDEIQTVDETVYSWICSGFKSKDCLDKRPAVLLQNPQLVDGQKDQTIEV